ncbi:unnamed protein product, partial [Heterosigma akashiwo]
FPKRVFVQVFEKQISEGPERAPSPEGQLVQEEMRLRSIPVVTLTTEEFLANPPSLERTDLVVGDFDWTRMALRQLGISMPEPPDYPDCLKHLLHRTIWTSTLAEVQQLLKKASKPTQLFIKPAADTKAFAGLVASNSEDDFWLEYLLGQFDPAFPVLCSTLLDIVAEYRAYAVDGEVRACCHYKGPSTPGPDMAVVGAAVRALAASAEGRALRGCGADFAVGRGGAATATGAVEVNDGYRWAPDAGLSGKDYTDVLVARWEGLVGGGDGV